MGAASVHLRGDSTPTTPQPQFLPRLFPRRPALPAAAFFSSSSFFSLDLHLDACGDFTVQPDSDLEIAEAFDRVAQLDLAAIDLMALEASSAAISADVTEPKSWPLRPPYG